MKKLSQQDRTRLRQCEVVIWRLMHKKAGLDYGDYSAAWQSWFDDRATDLGKSLDQILRAHEPISVHFCFSRTGASRGRIPVIVV